MKRRELKEVRLHRKSEQTKKTAQTISLETIASASLQCETKESSRESIRSGCIRTHDYRICTKNVDTILCMRLRGQNMSVCAMISDTEITDFQLIDRGWVRSKSDQPIDNPLLSMISDSKTVLAPNNASIHHTNSFFTIVNENLFEIVHLTAYSSQLDLKRKFFENKIHY